VSKFSRIIIFVLAVIALYLAAAGWTRVEAYRLLKEHSQSAQVVYEGMNFANEADRDFVIAKRDAEAVFPWTFKLPQSVSLLLTATSFGFLGGVIKLLFDIAQMDPSPRQPFVSLALSTLTGLLVLGIAFALPSAITTSEVTIRPVVLLFLCFLGGIFSQHLLLWLRDHFEAIFPRTVEKKPSQ
jgi:hypothetical protein